MDVQNEASQTEATQSRVSRGFDTQRSATILRGSVEDVAAQQAREDTYTRQTALQQACHDLKGLSDAQDTVDRARAYFAFLKNG